MSNLGNKTNNMEHGDKMVSDKCRTSVSLWSPVVALKSDSGYVMPLPYPCANMFCHVQDVLQKEILENFPDMMNADEV